MLWSGALLGAIFSKILDMLTFMAPYSLRCSDYVNDPFCFFRTAVWILIQFGMFSLVVMGVFAVILKRIYKSKYWT